MKFCKSLMIKTIETCQRYDKLCVKSEILTSVHLLVLLCELSKDVQLS